MNHTELIGAIEVQILYAPPFALGGYARFLQALCSVVVLHRPEKQDHKQYEKCWNCNLLYPCPTIQAIEKEIA